MGPRETIGAVHFKVLAKQVLFGFLTLNHLPPLPSPPLPAQVVAPRGISDLKGVFSPSAAEADVAPGFGAVLQEGVNKVAVFKEEDGTVRRMSAICPHLGCLVEYNSNDQTFDCACHGSQFDTRGRCINGESRVGGELDANEFSKFRALAGC